MPEMTEEEYVKLRTLVGNDLKQLMHIHEKRADPEVLAIIMLEVAVGAAHYFDKSEDVVQTIVHDIYKERNKPK